MFDRLFSLLFRKKNKNYSDFDASHKEKIINRVKELVGQEPKDEKFYLKAFTHRSYLEKANGNVKSNERLEFLGDSILGKIAAEYLFLNYPHKKEGFLTKSRSHLVNKHSLEKIGFQLKLQDLLFINDKYLIKDKKKLSNIVADALEALIAAIYLDLGESATKYFVEEYIIRPQVSSGDISYDKNYKGQLLEYSHANKLAQPIYSILDQAGPQHDKIYTIEVIVSDHIKGVGKGPNKKIAEQEAAKSALIIAEVIQA